MESTIKLADGEVVFGTEDLKDNKTYISSAGTVFLWDSDSKTGVVLGNLEKNRWDVGERLRAFNDPFKAVPAGTVITLFV